MRVVAFFLLLTLAAPGVATAQGAACPNDTATAVAQAKAALSSSDMSRDRAALVCLTEAVAALDAKLNDLIAGKVQFTGPVWSPKGMTVTRPDDQTGGE